MRIGVLARRLAPWLIGAAILLLLFERVPWAAFRQALAEGPVAAVSIFICVQVSVTLLADGWATWVSLSVCGVRRPLREVVLVRGATYLFGQISYALGQGGVGLYLHRAGIPGARATSLVVFLLAVNGAALGLLALSAWPLVLGEPRGGWLGAAAGILVLVLVLLLAARWLRSGKGSGRNHPWLGPWRAAGPVGAARALGARLIHAAVLVAGLWLAMRIWGIPVPAVQGLLRVPLVLLVAALPVAPGGLGTTQAAQVLLFGQFVDAAQPAARESVVLACSLIYQVVGMGAQLVLAALCLGRLGRSGSGAGFSASR